MVYNKKTTAEEQALIRFLYMEKRYSLREIAGKVGRSAATVMRVLKESHSASRQSRTHANVTYKRRGRPRKLSSREERLLIRALHKLRRTEGNFTVKRLMNEANILVSNASVRTVARFLNSQGYFYLQARLLTMTRTYASHLPKRSDKSTTRSYGHKKLLSTWTELLLHTKPTHLIKHELLLEGSNKKNQKVSINIAQGKGVKLDLEERYSSI